MRAGIESAVPQGQCVVFAVSAPIRLSAQTGVALIELTRARLALGLTAAASLGVQVLHGNDVRVRVVATRSRHAVRVAGFVHNPDPPPDSLLDLAQSLLARADPLDGGGNDDAAPDAIVLRAACAQVFDAEGFAVIFADTRSPRIVTSGRRSA